MTIKPEVLAAMERINNAFGWIELTCECDEACADLQLLRSELLAMDAKLGEADGLLRDAREWNWLDEDRPSSMCDLDSRIDAYLQGGAGK